MKRLTFKSPLSLMILFISTNSQPLFSNGITLTLKLSSQIWNSCCKYFETVYYMMTYLLVFNCLLNWLLLSTATHSMQRDKMHSLQTKWGRRIILICPIINCCCPGYSKLLTVAPIFAVFVGTLLFN